MIIIVFGLPATGKTFFAKRLANEYKGAYLSTDLEREKQGLRGDYDQQSKNLVYNELLVQLAAHVQYKKNVIVDGTFHKDSERERFIEKAEQLEQDLFFIETKATDQTVQQRLKTKRKHSDADYKVYLQIKSEFEPVYQSHLILWSDELTPGEMIEKTNTYIYGQGTDSENKR